MRYSITVLPMLHWPIYVGHGLREHRLAKVAGIYFSFFVFFFFIKNSHVTRAIIRAYII